MEKRRLCPICRKKKVRKKDSFWPFCSERCKKVDLGKWALGEYRVAGEGAQKDKEEEKEKKDVD